MFESLAAEAPDPLLALIAAYREDPRPDKIDLGVGVYRNANGDTPIMQAVKAAEQTLWQTQTTKAYLGAHGDIEYSAAVRDMVFSDTVDPALIAMMQTPGGTGGLRIAADLYKVTCPEGKIWVGLPTWPNHLPVFSAAGLSIRELPYFDVASQGLQLDAMIDGLREARAGDAVLLHGCCHNPTGADLSLEQWRRIGELLAERELLPIIDMAYYGLGQGLEEDLAGARLLMASMPELIVVSSCSKNFGIYRDRLGSIFAKTRSPEAAAKVHATLGSISRRSYSMPPDHGAAVVRSILHSPDLRRIWREELDAMRDDLNGLRQRLATEGSDLGLEAVGAQFGMFSTLRLSPEQVRTLREAHGVYMAGSGRINIAGLNEETVPLFLQALRAVH